MGLFGQEKSALKDAFLGGVAKLLIIS